MGMKVLDPGELKSILEGKKALGLKVVFTNGCFDIIHAGHVSYLREARALGDVLVVGLNSDRSVSSIKPGRPLVPEAERAVVLSALEMVDYVAVFDEDTPYSLIDLLRPDVLVKGGDWEVKNIVGADIVPETHSLPFRKGVSTTDIIEKCRGLKS